MEKILEFQDVSDKKSLEYQGWGQKSWNSNQKASEAPSYVEKLEFQVVKSKKIL